MGCLLAAKCIIPGALYWTVPVLLGANRPLAAHRLSRGNKTTLAMPGMTILHYEFLEKIGSGGMGEVFKALDNRLNRNVAIKLLPYGMSADPDRRRRFIQEAQTASALNHPNIITIHDIFHEGDTHFIVMELVAGRTLLESIPPGGMNIGQML